MDLKAVPVLPGGEAAIDYHPVTPTLHAVWNTRDFPDAAIPAQDAALLCSAGIEYFAEGSWRFPHAELRGDWFAFGYDEFYPPRSEQRTGPSGWSWRNTTTGMQTVTSRPSGFACCLQQYTGSIERECSECQSDPITDRQGACGNERDSYEAPEKARRINAVDASRQVKPN